MAKAPQAQAGIAADKESAVLLYRSIMTGATDDYSAKLNKSWREYSKRSLRDGEKVREAIRKEVNALRKVADGNGGIIKPGSRALAPFSTKTEKSLAWWIDREYTRLGIFPTQSRKSAVSVFGEDFNSKRGGPAKTVDPASKAARDAIKQANRRLGLASDKDLEAALDSAADGVDLQRESWVDNIVRALEQARHQARASFSLDAISAPEPVSALTDAVNSFRIPSNLIELSYKTHPRAAYRSTMAAAAPAIGAEHFMYYLPADARADAAPNGFGASHHERIETAKTWEAIRRGLGHRRPGSFIFSTGFHPNDKGYLIPVPKTFLDIAREIARKARQKFLEGKRS